MGKCWQPWKTFVALQTWEDPPPHLPHFVWSSIPKPVHAVALEACQRWTTSSSYLQPAPGLRSVYCICNCHDLTHLCHNSAFTTMILTLICHMCQQMRKMRRETSLGRTLSLDLCCSHWHKQNGPQCQLGGWGWGWGCLFSLLAWLGSNISANNSKCWVPGGIF